MRIHTGQIVVPQFQAGRSIEQNLQTVGEFAASLSERFTSSENGPATELELLKLSTRLKNEALGHTAQFDPKTAAFQGSQTALKLAVAAAAAGAIDAVVFAQTQDTPFAVSAFTDDQSLSREDFDKMSRMRQTIDHCASSVVNFSRGQDKDPQFAGKLINRSMETLVEALQDNDAGPDGYFQLGYRLGALSGTASAARARRSDLYSRRAY